MSFQHRGRRTRLGDSRFDLETKSFMRESLVEIKAEETLLTTALLLWAGWWRFMGDGFQFGSLRLGEWEV
jgi:hypothetical protein